MKVLAVIGGIALWFLFAFLGYWWGRVMLPAVGLTAPEYWTWFWAMLPLIVAGGVLWFIEEVLS